MQKIMQAGLHWYVRSAHSCSLLYKKVRPAASYLCLESSTHSTPIPTPTESLCCASCQRQSHVNLELTPGQTDSQVNANQRKFLTCFRLAFRLATPTCVDLCWLWSSSNSYGSRRTIFTVWPLNCKSTQVDCKSIVYAWNLLFVTCVDIGLYLQTCVDLHWLKNPFGQGFSYELCNQTICTNMGNFVV